LSACTTLPQNKYYTTFSVGVYVSSISALSDLFLSCAQSQKYS
jgi:hypothetical protein